MTKSVQVSVSNIETIKCLLLTKVNSLDLFAENFGTAHDKEILNEIIEIAQKGLELLE